MRLIQKDLLFKNMKQTLSVIFFGTPKLAVPFLDRLNQEDSISIKAVISQPDKPVGRKHIQIPSPIKQYAQNNNLPLLQPKTLKSKNIFEEIKSIEAQMFIVVAYGNLLPKNILNLPHFGVVNVHPSLLPRHRGPSPIPFAIRLGDKQSGLSIMLLDEGMDTGPLLALKTIPISERETTTSFTEKIISLGPEFLLQTIKNYQDGLIKPIPQDNSKATQTYLLSRQDGRINWSLAAQDIDRQIRAMNPWPSSWTIWQKKGQPIRLKILEVKITSFASTKPAGSVFVKDDHLYVHTSDKALEILTLQIEGKSCISSSQFIHGYGSYLDFFE